MKDIAIVGAGQAGLLLGIALQKNRFNVSIYTDRDAATILNGHILSSQTTFNNALQIEKDLGMNFWEHDAPKNVSMTFSLINPENQETEIHWKGYTKNYYQSVDQRLKFSRWLTEFEKLGGLVKITGIKKTDLIDLTESHDLVIVASGKGDLSDLFLKNQFLSTFDKPQRVLSCLYVHGMITVNDKPGIRGSSIPGIGEYFVLPGFTLSGACEIMLFEGIPQGPFDCWPKNMTAPEQLETALKLLKQFVPVEYEHAKNIVLTDAKAVLRGGYTPIIKHPTATLANGKNVLGMGDAIVLNDPIVGQGANNATMCAQIYKKRILEHTGNFNESWMIDTFAQYWQEVQPATTWATMLLSPRIEHISEMLTAATNNQSIANILTQGFEDPKTLFPWILNKKTTEEKMGFVFIGTEKS